MFTIFMNEKKDLWLSPDNDPIYQKENLVDTFRILIPETRNDMDLKDFKAYLQYVQPGNLVRTEELVQSAELYKGKIEYTLPIDTSFTLFAGTVHDVNLTLIKKEKIDEKTIEYRMHTESLDIEILPTNDYGDYEYPENDNTEITEGEVEIIEF